MSARVTINRIRGFHWHAANAVFISLPAVGLWYYLSGKRGAHVEKAKLARAAQPQSATAAAAPNTRVLYANAGTQTTLTTVKAAQTPPKPAVVAAKAKSPAPEGK